MNLVIISLVIGSVWLSTLYFATRSKMPFGNAACSAVAVLIFSCFCFSPILIIPALITLLTAGICEVAKAPPVVLWRVALTSTIAMYALGMGHTVVKWQRWLALREKLPVESVAERLEYEAKHPALAAEVKLDDLVESRLQLQQRTIEERSDDYGQRQRYLRILHSDSSEAFIASEGFGVGRGMPRTISSEQLLLPPAPPVKLPPPPYVPEKTTDQPPLAQADAPSREALLLMHDAGQADFLKPERTGYVVARQRVAGFESHRFEKIPAVEDAGKLQAWQLVRLELVSLLKHAEPAAYLSEHLPRMDELAQAKTRPLDAFEKNGLEKLRSEEDIVIDDQPTRIRMLGALRAGESCRECHNVPRGALLGAFTYEFVPLVKPRTEDRPPPL